MVMIISFADKDTERLARYEFVKRFQLFERIALRKLVQLDIAMNLDDLRVTIKKGRTMNIKKLNPVTPGELLLEEFLVPMNLTKYRLAKDINVSAQRIGQIVAGKRAITADTDLRLCKYFGLSEGYWLRLQNKYDVEVEKSKIRKQLDQIVPFAKLHLNNHN